MLTHTNMQIRTDFPPKCLEEMTFTPPSEWELRVRISSSIRMYRILSTSQTCVPLYAHCVFTRAKILPEVK